MRRRYQAGIRAGDAPVVYVDRGLLVRERIFVPLWVTLLGSFLGGCWRLLVRVVRFAWRYPVPTIAGITVVVVSRWRGWAAVVFLTVTVVLLLAVWWWVWPGSFTRWLVVPLRGWWRFRRVYSRRWRELMAGCGLLEVHDGYEAMPQIARLAAYRDRDELQVTLAPGQIPADVTDSVEAFGHGLGAWRVAAYPAGPGRVRVLVLWTDPLADPVSPDDSADDSGPGLGDGSGGHRWRAGIEAGQVLHRLRSVPVGVNESGAAWSLCLLPGRHLLVVGASGSGKSGLLWAILWRLRDLIGAGWVTVTALDPKYVELRAVASCGLGTVHVDVPVMPDVLEDLVRELNARCGAMTGRTHVPSPASPVRIVVIDELATLTALADAKSRARVEQALGHLLSRGRAAGYLVILTSVEATKEVVRWRGLCPARVCYRTEDEQADLVLRNGAHDAGALTELIDEDTPGIAYTHIEGRAGIQRVRTFHITDDHLAGLASTGTVTDRGEPGGQPDGSSDTQPAGGPEAVESPSPNVIDLSSRGPERRGGFWSAS